MGFVFNCCGRRKGEQGTRQLGCPQSSERFRGLPDHPQSHRTSNPSGAAELHGPRVGLDLQRGEDPGGPRPTPTLTMVVAAAAASDSDVAGPRVASEQLTSGVGWKPVGSDAGALAVRAPLAQTFRPSRGPWPLPFSERSARDQSVRWDSFPWRRRPGTSNLKL